MIQNSRLNVVVYDITTSVWAMLLPNRLGEWRLVPLQTVQGTLRLHLLTRFCRTLKNYAPYTHKVLLWYNVASSAEFELHEVVEFMRMNGCLDEVHLNDSSLRPLKEEKREVTSLSDDCGRQTRGYCTFETLSFVWP